MKLILSRKGMDSSFGNVPSPILPDGTLCWLPIPENSPMKHGLPTYDHLSINGWSLGDIVEDLSKGKVARHQTVHLDPDLMQGYITRPAVWRPAFGQAGAAERHLLRLGVSSGDLFLFFGWFRQTELRNGRLVYAQNAPDVHLIYGWLQIEERLSLDITFVCPPGLEEHAHVRGERYDEIDSIYIPRSCLDCPDIAPGLPGHGAFKKFNASLVLTALGQSRSRWKLPVDFLPNGRSPLTYHGDEKRWHSDGKNAFLRTVGRGQEFVLELDHYPGVRRWLNQEIFGSIPV